MNVDEYELVIIDFRLVTNIEVLVIIDFCINSRHLELDLYFSFSHE